MYGQGAEPGRGGENGRRLHNGNLYGAQRSHPDEGRWGTERMGDRPISEQSSFGQDVQQQCQDTSRDPQYMGGFSMISPNQSKREKTQTIAKQELENWEHFKQGQKHGPINLTPKKLGGGITQGEARWNQQVTQSQSKYQKMLKREEYKKKVREEEEAQIQKMKDIQRQKAERLEEKNLQQEAQRQIEYGEDRYRRNNAFLNLLSQTETHYQNQTRECHGNPYKAQIQREEYKNKQRAEEEARIQAMKGIQRQKAEKLEETARQEDLKRQIKWQEDRHKTNNAFLNQMSWPAVSYEDYETYTNQSYGDLPTAWAVSNAYRQEQKMQEQRQLQQMKEEQRRKSELLDVTRIKQEKESRLTEQEERRR
ncbi:hypothetical protein XENTR_v10006528 [Xenopus tropicalis]|nr:hypothetical protein XENTR_v10006528 [Xenopus tropicalis]